jgi:hypothetical protein
MRRDVVVTGGVLVGALVALAIGVGGRSGASRLLSLRRK